MAEQEEGGAPAPALIETAFQAEAVNVITQDAAPGAPAHIRLRFLVGPTGDGFLHANVAQLAPELAIQLGEHLSAEGRRLKSGLLIPGTEVPADLRGAPGPGFPGHDC